MATSTDSNGLPSAFNGNSGADQCGDLWRPWSTKEGEPAADRVHSSHGHQSFAKQQKIPHFVHPVKLFWPKSRCFDYLYRDAEMLLRNYPVQATICLFEDTSSDEDGDEEEEEEEEEMEKDLN